MLTVESGLVKTPSPAPRAQSSTGVLARAGEPGVARCATYGATGWRCVVRHGRDARDARATTSRRIVRGTGRPVARASSPVPTGAARTLRTRSTHSTRSTRSTGVPRFPSVRSTGCRCGTLAAPLNKALNSVARTPNPPSLFRRPSTRNRSAAIIRRRLAKGRIHVADTTVPGRLPISGRHHRASPGAAGPRGHHHLRNVQRTAFGGRPEQAAFDDARLFAGHPLQFSGAGNGG